MFTRKKKLILGGAVAAVGAVALGGAAFVYSIIPHDTPDKVTLGSAVASLETSPAAATDTSTQSNDLNGTWEIAVGSESFVGYRVQEELATVGTFTAVGRTSNITGTLEFDGSAITAVDVTADLTGLTSDSSMRDGQLKRQALETNTYPTATFALTQPIQLNAVPANGETIAATAVGDLTLHGVTRSISIPLEGQLTGGYAVIVGSLDVAFTDFGIQKPTSGMVLSIEDHGVLELQLVFQKGTSG
jgi:polyisoprenoid-binding protein YceI